MTALRELIWLTVVGLVVLILRPLATFGQTAEIPWFSINSGGEYSVGGEFEIESVIGQSMAGPVMIGGQFELTSGFLPPFSLDNSDGPLILDGDMDLLDVGTNPDVGVPAGSWAFPPHYDLSGLVEFNLPDMSIVPTSSFDPGTSGNSLMLDNSELQGNIHLPNLLNRRIYETPGVLVQVSFDIFVPDAGTSGGSVYVGGDHGEGGFGNTMDRGPQLTWNADGTIQHTFEGANNQIVVPSFPFGQWQSVRMLIDLPNDTFDLYWAPHGEPLEQVGEDLGFRSGTQDHIDRFTYAHFTNFGTPARSALDNVAIELVAAPVCAFAGTLIEGTGQQNNFNATCGSDDVRWAAHGATFVFQINDPVVQFELTATAPAEFDGNSISVDVEASKANNNANLILRAQLYNFTTSNYVALPGILNLTTIDQVKNYALPAGSSPSDFIQAGTNQVRLLLQTIQTSGLANVRTQLDQVLFKFE